MSSFQERTGSFLTKTPVLVIAPATGSTVKFDTTVRTVFVNNASTTAALTFKLPSVEGGDRFAIGAKSAVTAVTFQTQTGGATAGLPTTLAAGAVRELLYVNSTIGWIVFR